MSNLQGKTLARESYHSSTSSSSILSLSIKDSHIEKWQPTRSFYLAFSSLFVITLAAAIGSTSISIALPVIAKKLSLSNVQAFWLGTTTAITSTVIQPTCAPLSDAVGRKWALAVSVLVLIAGSLAGSVAQDFTVMVVARCLQGLGIGGITAVTEIIVTEMVPLRLRGKWLALISVAWAAGTVSGPLLGGLLAEVNDWSWRLIFAVIAPICALGLVLCVFTLDSRRARTGVWESLRQVDWIGFLLFTAAVVCILVPITQARVVYSWSDRRTIIPICVGAATLVAFALHECLWATHPMIPFDIFKNQSCVATFTATALHGLVLWCLLYYVPLYYEAVKGMTPLESGIAILPETASLVPASVITGLLITVTGRYRWGIWSGWAVMTVGMGTLYFLQVGTSTAQWIGLNLVVGFGNGILFGSMGFAVQASVSHDLLAVAVTLFSFFRSLGAAIGVATGGAIFQNEIESRLSGTGSNATSAVMPKNSLTIISDIRTMVESPEKTFLVQAIADSLQRIWIDMCIVCGIALVVALFIRHYTLDVALPGSTYSLEGDTDNEESGSWA